MHYYETLYIVNPSLTEDDYKGVVSKYASAAEKNGGVVINVAEWGKKSLAYEVRKFTQVFMCSFSTAVMRAQAKRSSTR